jgi:hypothetical protein
LVILAATLAQRRFAYYLVVNVAVLSGYLSWQAIWYAGLRKVTAKTDEKPEKDVPFPEDFEERRAEFLADRLDHYAFRLFLRGANSSHTLVLVDGPPVYRPVEKTDLERVFNTRALILLDKSGQHYLHLFDGYLQATGLGGPWTRAEKMPAAALWAGWSRKSASSACRQELARAGFGELACTMFMGVPTMYLRMMDRMGGERRDFPSHPAFGLWICPLLPKDFERIKEVFGKEPVEREGMSETGMNFSNPLRGMKKPGSIGLPLPDVNVRIVNPETFRDLKSGEVGEIWLRGPNVTPGYWGKPLETEASFVNGWFRTGDLGKRDEEGYYYITDRLKHIIISGGENISLAVFCEIQMS